MGRLQLLAPGKQKGRTRNGFKAWKTCTRMLSRTDQLRHQICVEYDPSISRSLFLRVMSSSPPTSNLCLPLHPSEGSAMPAHLHYLLNSCLIAASSLGNASLGSNSAPRIAGNLPWCASSIACSTGVEHLSSPNMQGKMEQLSLMPNI